MRSYNRTANHSKANVTLKSTKIKNFVIDLKKIEIWVYNWPWHASRGCRLLLSVNFRACVDLYFS
jgi:hypothetical protein